MRVARCAEPRSTPLWPSGSARISSGSRHTRVATASRRTCSCSLWEYISGASRPRGAAPIVARALSGRIDLANYRGRSVYAARVQAAEVAVRSARKLDGVAELELVDADGAIVRFRDSAGREHVAVVEESVGPTVPASCGADPEPQAGFVARLV